MQKIYKVSERNIVGVWIIFGVIFLYWCVLLSVSGNDPRSILEAIVSLFIALSFMPLVMTFFVYVIVDDQKLTVPMGVFFRKSIPIKNIRALRYRPHGLGFFKGIVVDYSDAFGASRSAIFPSLSTFGTTKTAQMIKQLADVNPSIKIDRNRHEAPTSRSRD